MSLDCTLMPGPDLLTPEAWLRCAERRELLRIAAANVLKNPRADAHTRAWAEPIARWPALTTPLTEGA
jgi:hypothetical protein